jgi:hypothetical protein
MKDKDVDIYLVNPIIIPPDDIYINGREGSLISGKITGVYNGDMLVVKGKLFFFNEGQGWVLVTLSNSDTFMVPKSNVRAIIVKNTIDE